jgi:hypothetical protein
LLRKRQRSAPKPHGTQQTPALSTEYTDIAHHKTLYCRVYRADELPTGPEARKRLVLVLSYAGVRPTQQRQTQADRQRETDTDTHRETEREKETDIERHTQRETDRQTARQREREAE